MSKNQIITMATKLGIGLLVFISIFSVGFFIGKNSTPKNETLSILDTSSGDQAKVDFGTFWKAWKLLDEKFIDTATTTDGKTKEAENRVWGAISGMTASLGDPFTVFFPPEENKYFESEISGSFSGVGMEIGIKDGYLTVIAPLKGTPADRAGILPGDQIIQIDDNSAINMPAEYAVKLIRGPKGTSVILTILREGGNDPIEISVTRDTIQIPTIDTEFRQTQTINQNTNQNLINNVFVIRLYNFSEPSPVLFQQKLREFIESGADKLILDLRGNPGGYLGASIDMASWFLPLGKPIVIESYGGKSPNIVHRSRGYDVFNKNLKMAILVDNGSASASEILAGALQEHGVAKLIGTQTFGKGSVQELINITSETSLKVTIAKWLTPNGLSISHGGLTPDYVVERTAKDRENGIDPQMEKAVEVLNSL